MAAGTSPPPLAEAVTRALAQVGVHVKVAWTEACVAHLTRSLNGFEALPLKRQVEECYLQFLEADVNVAGAGCLPTREDGGREAEAVSGSAGVHVGRFVLQMDEVLNASASFNERYAEKRAGSDRTLKLSLTDGVSRVVGYEYRPIQELRVNMPAGVKVAVTDVLTRGGALFLQPENLKVLGGRVERLDAARRRAVAEWEKPNRPIGGRERETTQARGAGVGAGSNPGGGAGATAGGTPPRERAVRRAAWHSEDASLSVAVGAGAGVAAQVGRAPVHCLDGTRAPIDPPAPPSSSCFPARRQPPRRDARRADDTGGEGDVRGGGARAGDAGCAADATRARRERGAATSGIEGGKEGGDPEPVKRRRVIKIDDSDDEDDVAGDTAGDPACDPAGEGRRSSAVATRSAPVVDSQPGGRTVARGAFSDDAAATMAVPSEKTPRRGDVVDALPTVTGTAAVNPGVNGQGRPSADVPGAAPAPPPAAHSQPPITAPVPPHSGVADVPMGPLPRWAKYLADKPPFTYITGVTCLRQSMGPAKPGERPRNTTVVFHAWMCKVGRLRVVWAPDTKHQEGARARALAMRVVLNDGTGQLAAEVDSACLLRSLGGKLTADAFATMSEEERAARADWLRGFFLAFLGRVSVSVSTCDDGELATVNRIAGPEDHYNVEDIRQLGGRYAQLNKKHSQSKGGSGGSGEAVVTAPPKRPHHG